MAKRHRDQEDSWDEAGLAEPDEPQVVDPEHELPGSVYMVPDRVWGFQALGREDHPGACARCDVGLRQVWMFKGTDPASARLDRYSVLLVEPSAENGLHKTTAFALEPRQVRLHKVLLLHRSTRRLGRLEPAELQSLQAELLRSFTAGPPAGP
jgi:hypothetical protein